MGKKKNIKRIKYGVELISEERGRQITDLGRTPDYDILNNPCGTLSGGAAFIITLNPIFFPTNWDQSFIEKWDKKTEKERMIIAGALIAAEIDRIIADENFR